MKTLSLFLLTIFLSKGCSNQTQNDLANSVVQYTADSRGFHLKIIITNKKASIFQGRGTENPSQEIVIPNEQWNEMVTEFQKINLEQIPNLKDPSQKRFHDGAAIANFKIRYQDKNYETVAFDHGNPPAEIEKLVKSIVALAVKE